MKRKHSNVRLTELAQASFPATVAAYEGLQLGI